jgi:hypothetical protein
MGSSNVEYVLPGIANISHAVLAPTGRCAYFGTRRAVQYNPAWYVNCDWEGCPQGPVYCQGIIVHHVSAPLLQCGERDLSRL